MKIKKIKPSPKQERAFCAIIAHFLIYRQLLLAALE